MKPASEFYRDPFKIKSGAPPEPPVTTVVDKLTGERGAQLQLMGRTTPRLIEAAQINMIYSEVLGSKFCAERFDLIMRMMVGLNGEGRKDVIESLRAGGALPDTYYSQGKPRPSEYEYIRDEEPTA